MKFLKQNFKEFIFPVHWLLPVVFTFILNNSIYFGVRPFVEHKYHYDMTTSLDKMIPFMPQFILVYFGCFIFWVINYCMIAKQNKEQRYRFFTADFYARLVCLAFFIFLPTTNIRPELVGNNIWICLVRFLYKIDQPNNLFPSIHCMASWFSYIGIRKNQKIPSWYRRLSCIIAVTVFFSTLTLKQHVIADVVAGAALAEITYFVSRHTNGYLVYMRIFERLGDKITEKLVNHYKTSPPKRSGLLRRHSRFHPFL